jgi:hypothetical protein
VKRSSLYIGLCRYLAGDANELSDPVGVELADLVLHIVVSQGEVQLLVRLTELIAHLTNQKISCIFKYRLSHFRNIHQQ